MKSSLEHPTPSPEFSLNNQEKIETPRDIIHFEMNELLLDAHKQNEGAAGIIIKLDAANFSQRMKDALYESGIEITEDTAAKLLKIYSPGTIRREFLMQQKAYESINKDAENLQNGSIAKIPKPLFYSEIPLNPAVADNMRAEGIDLHHSNIVEILLMDWIPGEDLMTQMFKKVLEFFPNHPALPDNPNDFKQLRFAVSIVLGLEAPDVNVIDAVHKEKNEAITDRRNMEKVRIFLKNKNLKINSKVTKQLEKCIETLHKNGVWHNDIHERNVEIIGDIFKDSTDEEISTYLIDFGRSTSTPKEMVVNDKDLLNILKKDSIVELSLEERLKESRDITTSPNYLNTLKMIHAAAKNNPVNGVQAAYSLFSDDYGYKTIFALKDLIENGLIEKSVVKERILEILSSTNEKRFSRRKNLKDYIACL